MKQVVFILFFFFQSTSQASVELMNQAFENIVNLQGYVIDKTKFTDPKHEENITASLFELESIFGKVHKSIGKESAEFYAPSKLLREKIEDVRLAFSNDHKYYARNRLLSVTSNCVSCHSQLITVSSELQKKKKYMTLHGENSDFEKAEFNFLLRNYKDALKLYRDIIEKHSVKLSKLDKNNQYRSREFDIAVKRTLYYILKIKSDIDSAKKFVFDLSVLIQERDLNNEYKKWLEQLITLKKEIDSNNLSSYKSVIDFTSRSFSKEELFDNEVRDLYLLGKVLRLSGSTSSDENKAQSLLWVSRLEREIDEDYFYSLPNEYLIQCIEKYPRTKFSKKCYEELEFSFKVEFSGSSGLSLPKDIVKKLEKYKKMIQI